MYGVGDARCAVVKPREGRVPAGLVPCDQDDPGAHFCKCHRGDLANSGRAARDDNSLTDGNLIAVEMRLSVKCDALGCTSEAKQMSQVFKFRFAKTGSACPLLSNRWGNRPA